MADSRKHQHADGWSSDEIFRSMRRNAEAYKKKDMELIKVKREKEEILNDMKDSLEDFTTEGEVILNKDEGGGNSNCKIDVTFYQEKDKCEIKCYDIDIWDENYYFTFDINIIEGKYSLVETGAGYSLIDHIDGKSKTDPNGRWLGQAVNFKKMNLFTRYLKYKSIYPPEK